MLLCIALFNSRVCASFIYDIDRYTQVGGESGDSTFTDEFSDGTVPSTGSTYYVIGDIISTRESGGLLELNSEDATIVENEDGDMEVNILLIENTYFFSSDAGGSIAGRFEVNDGFSPDTFFGIELWNHNSTTQTSSDANVAWAEIAVDSLGNKYAVWGNEFVGGGHRTLLLLWERKRI